LFSAAAAEIFINCFLFSAAAAENCLGLGGGG
jgi:hypothetical protein